ncbi:uncharacterized protein LOC144436737 [Glandiceps talaboti]
MESFVSRSVAMVLLPCLFSFNLKSVESTVYMNDNCGKTVILHGDRLRSQKDDYYPDNMDCKLTLRAPSGYEHLRLKFDWFDFERLNNTHCNDYLEIYDNGTLVDVSSLPNDCGSSPYTQNFDGDPLDIEFHLLSNEIIISRGFSLVFTFYRLTTDGNCLDGSEVFNCTNDRCISKSLECDCRDNCFTNDDELYCSTCKPDKIYGTGLSTGAIVGIVLGVLVGMAVIVGISAYIVYRYKKTR